jgi:hypothetical protein
MDAAKARILRGTGHAAEVQQFANERLELMRKEWHNARSKCDWGGWLQSPTWYASLAANEGLKAEAVAALKHAMHCGDMPFGFWPQLPWFRSLEGYPPYDALLKERQARVTRIRGDLLQLETEARAKQSSGEVVR